MNRPSPGAARALALLLALLAAGCDTATRARRSGLSLSVSVEAPDSVRTGESATIGVRLENVTDRTVTVWPAAARDLAFDVRVLRDGREVWRAWSGLLAGPGGRPFDLEPGHSVTETKQWDLRDRDGVRVAPGRYTLEGAVHLAPATRLVSVRDLVIAEP